VVTVSAARIKAEPLDFFSKNFFLRWSLAEVLPATLPTASTFPGWTCLEADDL